MINIKAKALDRLVGQGFRVSSLFNAVVGFS